MVLVEVFCVSMATKLTFLLLIGARDLHHIRVSYHAGGFQTVSYRTLSGALYMVCNNGKAF